MINLRQTEKLLDTYSLEEVLEYNELTEAEALLVLFEQEVCQIPEPRPVDLDDDEN